jgi:hypothetical protein
MQQANTVTGNNDGQHRSASGVHFGANSDLCATSDLRALRINARSPVGFRVISKHDRLDRREKGRGATVLDACASFSWPILIRLSASNACRIAASTRLKKEVNKSD